MAGRRTFSMSSKAGFSGEGESPTAAARKVITSLAVERRAPAPARVGRSQWAAGSRAPSCGFAIRARIRGVRAMDVLAIPSGPVMRRFTRVS